MSQSLEDLRGGTTWTPATGWRRDVHPWMSAYCGYMALAMWQRFEGLHFALEYFQGRPAHALVHRGSLFYDARGALPDYHKEENPENEIHRYLHLCDLEDSGLLWQKNGVREAGNALDLAHQWINSRGFLSLDEIPLWPGKK